MVSPGTYRIRNAKSHTILDQSRKEAEIHGWQQHDQNNQHWYLQRAGDMWHIKNVESGTYCSVNGTQNGSKLRKSNSPFTWNLIPTGDQYFIGVPGDNAVVDLDMGRSDNGATVHLWDRTGAQQQKWSFEKINDNPGESQGGYQPQQQQQPTQQYQPPPQQYQPPPQQQQPVQQQPQQPQQQQQPSPVSPGTYVIKNVQAGTVIDLSRGAANEGADVFGYEYNGGNNQKWQVQPTGNGQNMTIQNLETKTFAGFPNQSFQQGVLVKATSQRQEFTFVAADKGIYISPAQQPGYVLDLARGDKKNGTQICVWQNNNQNNQKWYFERA